MKRKTDKQSQHFPQISRRINAKTIIYGVKIVVLGLITAFLALSLFFRLPSRFLGLESAKLAVLLSSNDLSNHLLLAQEYLKLGNMEAVERELTLAANLSSRPASSFQSSASSVLGVSLQPLKILTKIKNEPQKIKSEISFWEKVVSDKPDYRDGYLRLALLNYQIYETQKAKAYLQKAIILDPNFAATKELEKLLKTF